MNERYVQLYAPKAELYAEGAPVIIKSGALFGDNATGNVLLQLIFENVSHKMIIGLKVKITALDMADRRLGGDIEYQYMDVYAAPYSEFGSQNAIFLPDNTTRSFSIAVTEVIFNDKSIWDKKEEFEPIERDLLQGAFQDEDLIRQYQLMTNSGSIFIPKKYKDLYICSCGKAYKNTSGRCPSCGRIFDVLTKALDIDTLTREKDRRKQQEWEYRKKEEEMQRKITEKENEELLEAEMSRVERKEKIEGYAKIIVPIIAVIIVIIIVLSNIVVPRVRYKKAEELAAAGDYEGAIAAFENLEYFKDSPERALEIKHRKAVESIAGAKEMVAAGDYKNAIPIFKEARDDMMYTEWYPEIRKQILELWDKISGKAVVVAGYDHTVGLKADGTVVAAGNNGSGQCDVRTWKDIISVSAGGGYTVGLKSDGTVVAVGYNEYGQCDVEDWTDIVAVSAGNHHTVGLKADGTIVAVGNNNFGECAVDDWTDIVFISAGCQYTVGLKSDGTVVAVGDNYGGKCDVSGFANIKLPK